MRAAGPAALALLLAALAAAPAAAPLPGLPPLSPPPAAPQPAAAPPAWALEGAATLASGHPAGTPCASVPFPLPGRVRVALAEGPQGFDALAFAFDTAGEVRPPCALARAGCLGAGDAAQGWRGVCAEGFPTVTWRLAPRGDGTGGYDFSSVAPLGPAGWAVWGPVAPALR